MIVDPQTGEEIFNHPGTAEPIETHQQALEALAWIEEQMAPYYRVRRSLRDFTTRRFPPAELPAKRYRTDKQALVARCPRCGGRLEDE